MTIARIPSSHPGAAQLPSLSATKPAAYDNSQSCSANPVRAIEDSVIYTATRCQVSMGGSCRKTNLSTSDSPANFRMQIAREPFTATTNIWVVASTDGASNTITVGSDTVTLAVNESVSDWNQKSVIVFAAPTGNGDKDDLGVSSVPVTVTINNSSVRIWSIMLEPVPLSPGNVTVS